MATNPISFHKSMSPSDEPMERRLNIDEGWDLILSLSGSSKGLYDDFGGVEAYVRQMRSDEPLA